MDFSLTQDQQSIQELAEKIISDRITDEFWHTFQQQECGYDKTLWTLLADAGLLSVALPEDMGGSGLGFIESCLLLQAQGRRLAPIPLLSTLIMGCLPLVNFGTKAQQQKYLPGVAAGDIILTGITSELAHNLETLPFSAEQEGDHWRINGTCDSVAYAEHSAAIIVPARVGEQLAIFIIEPDLSGVTLTPQATTHGEPAARVHLNNVLIEAESVLSKPAEGIKHWKMIEQHLLMGLSAMQLGVADNALYRTAQYSTERQQFGKALHTFQSVAHRAADAFIDTECMRTTLWQAVWRLSAGLCAENEVRVAKWWACEGGHRVAHSAQHLHGGIGADIDFPLHRYFLWAKQLEFSGGGARYQLEKLGTHISSMAAR